MKRIPRSRSMSHQISHLDGPYDCWSEPVGSLGRSSVARKIANAFTRRSSHETRLRDRRMICVSLPMVNAARGICSLRDVMHLCTMANQDDPRRHAKEGCTSASRIKAHQRIKKGASAPHIRVPGENILRQRVPLPRRTAMRLMPKPA